MNKLTLLTLLKFINKEQARFKKAQDSLYKRRYCGDEADRDDVTHQLAFNRGVLWALGAVRDNLQDVPFNPVVVQFIREDVK